MRARITITLAFVASLATFVVAFCVLQPTVSTAAPDELTHHHSRRIRYDAGDYHLPWAAPRCLRRLQQ